MRKRRLREGEEAKLLAYFAGKESTVPMTDVVLFALATARRQEEITRLRWDDLDRTRGVMALDDVKHPRHKEGNRKEFRILPEAIAIIDRQPKTADVVFPYDRRAVHARGRDARAAGSALSRSAARGDVAALRARLCDTRGRAVHAARVVGDAEAVCESQAGGCSGEVTGTAAMRLPWQALQKGSRPSHSGHQVKRHSPRGVNWPALQW